MGDVIYPQGAYAYDDVVWWRVTVLPGRRRALGDVPKFAAWLFYNKPVGTTFTMREARIAIGEDDVPNSAEHLNRRMRDLRKLGWRLPSSQEFADLKPDEYRVAETGWHPSLGTRPKVTGSISPKLRRQVFERDGFRCVICGVGVREEYPDPPTGLAVLSVGHRLSQEHGGGDELDNLQTECKRCNEQLREEAGNPDTFAEVYAQVKGLARADKAIVLQWLKAGRRIRSRIDIVYDQARRLSYDDKKILINKLQDATGVVEQDPARLSNSV